MSSSLRAMGRRLSVADWGSIMSACCKLWVQLFADAGNGWPHSTLWVSLAHATFKIAKALLVLNLSPEKYYNKY